MAAKGNGANDTGLRIVMFPWLAFGHMLPYLELSKALARRGHRISFISTPRNIQRLPKPPPEIAHLIDFVALDLPRVEGLREAAEATSDQTTEELPNLVKAFDGLERPFAEFIERARPKPDWIVQDYQHHWVPAIGAGHGIPCIFFSITTSAFLAYYNPPPELAGPLPPGWTPPPLEQLVVPPPWIPLPSKLAFRRHEVVKVIANLTAPNPLAASEPDRCKMVVEGSRAIAIRSADELDSKYVSLLARSLKKPVLSVGLLAPSAGERGEQANEAEAAIMKWLDRRSPRSVVYIALGSEAAIDVGLLHELALGLEAAGLPFVWALGRKYAKLLPEGFEDRTAGMGMVLVDWAPQVKILAHGTVGGFLTHCGWSSIIESLQAGCPLVMLPLDHDQMLNARLAEENELGAEVERNDDDGSFTREDVARAVRLVVVDAEGEAFRKRAMEMMEIVASKECRDKPVDDFVQFLLDHRSD